MYRAASARFFCVHTKLDSAPHSSIFDYNNNYCLILPSPYATYTLLYVDDDDVWQRDALANISSWRRTIYYKNAAFLRRLAKCASVCNKITYEERIFIFIHLWYIHTERATESGSHKNAASHRQKYISLLLNI